MSQTPSHSIQGIYEVCIGVRDAQPLIQYWQQFGYTVGETGKLSAADAERLYGVASSVQSIRLHHQTADHGLIRLMVWDSPINEGLSMAPMKAQGNRWATSLTLDVTNLWNHAAEAEANGLPIRYGPPQWTVIYPTAQGRPFLDPLVGVREMLLLQPLTRQVMFERFNYTVPDYGRPQLGSAFQASQVTHMGLVVQDDSQETLQFYDQVLGLLRVQDALESTYETARGGRQIFDLQPGERFWVTAFDDPRSSKTDWQAARSGRLYIVRFPEDLELPDFSEQSRPGVLGLSLYTYRVKGLEEYRVRIHSSSATHVTDIVTNEFGKQSFSFIAPDGYFWTLIEQ
ncbi:VOC family protein [Leptothoe sp. LEGE 181152]|uniref:VOC family protein n=1 Tax=Adonisia turfae CCMR0081 TaxID=2292702 RepID=A0A6M0RZJ4_9CYAN|nr:VOC family protein [Adonisia turfae]MDV3347249.1 VOC family protein [Leptothoe sp. LEGE 181152]NEZ61132.1 VOC family protein [Adonisia turfae CCMR0081]